MDGLSDHALKERLTTGIRSLAKYARRRANENAFVVHNIGTVASEGGTINIHLTNPTDNRIIDIEEFIISTEFVGRVDIYDGFSSGPTGGTTTTIENLRLDSDGGPPDSGSMTATNDVNFTAESTHVAIALPGGGSGGNAVSTEIDATTPLIEPGREIVLEATNTGSNTRLGSVGVVFTETTESYQ